MDLERVHRLVQRREVYVVAQGGGIENHGFHATSFFFSGDRSARGQGNGGNDIERGYALPVGCRYTL